LFSNGKIEPVRACPDRFHFSGVPSKRELKNLADNADIKTLQTTENISRKAAEILNESFFKFRPDVALRLYGFYNKERICNLEFCSSMDNVEHFSADCIHSATNINEIAKIPNLKSLGIGIYNHDNFDILNEVSPNLEDLCLGETKSKKPDLRSLQRFKDLKSLLISGHHKNIDAVTHCRKLESLSLRGISTDNLNYLKPLSSLSDLNIHLGGIKDFSALEHCTTIKKLDLFQIRGLSDLSFISKMKKLEVLFLQCLKNVQVLPDMQELIYLNRIVLETMNGLKDVSSLERIQSLKKFVHISAHNMQPEDYVPLFKNKNVISLRVGFGSEKKNVEFCKLAKQYGKNADEF